MAEGGFLSPQPPQLSSTKQTRIGDWGFILSGYSQCRWGGNANAVSNSVSPIQSYFFLLRFGRFALEVQSKIMGRLFWNLSHSSGSVIIWIIRTKKKIRTNYWIFRILRNSINCWWCRGALLNKLIVQIHPSPRDYLVGAVCLRYLMTTDLLSQLINTPGGEDYGLIQRSWD